MSDDTIIKQLRQIQAGIEGDRFTWENIEILIDRINESREGKHNEQ